MSATIVGIFATPAQASAAIHRLELQGISQDQMSVLASDSVDKEAFAVETNSKLPEGTAVGAMTGGAVGALVAGFTAVGTVATGGVGLIAAGPVVAALAGAGAGAASGGILGGLVGVAIPEHEVKHYEDAIGEGKVVVGVNTDDSDEKKSVKETFKDLDAEKVSHA